jgi:hypothetical protein
MSEEINPEDGIQLLRTIAAHRDYVRRGMQLLTHAIERRALAHDLSKLSPDEFAGFSRINKAAREYPYGSDEYRAGLKAEKSTIDLHYSRNTHHPEWVTDQERWMPVESAPGYEVSDFGRVRSVDRVVPREGEKGPLSRRGDMMALNITPKGYRRVQLRVDSKPSNRLVHVLVAEAFVEGRTSERIEVNHEDGRKLNNWHLNLSWVTPSENQQHAYDTGLKKPCVKWVYTCGEHPDLELVGGERMAAALRELGYNASAAGIWNAATGDHATHCGLHIKAQPVQEDEGVPAAEAMGFLDLIEMVIDWRSAYLTYGSQGTWDENMARQIERYREQFSSAQWWMINQVSAWLIAEESRQ